MTGPKDTNNPPPIPEPELPRHPDDDRMREEVKDDNLYLKKTKEIEKSASIHPWLYVIIPVSMTSNNQQDVIFSAFCKACRTYFTEKMQIDHYGAGTISPSSLPRYGCNPISDDVTRF